MIKLFCLALLSQLILVAAGWSLLQIASLRKRVPVITTLAFSWGTGMAFLYIVGGISASSSSLQGIWHVPVLLLALISLVAATILRLRIPKQEKKEDGRWNFRWYEGIILALILWRVITVFLIQRVFPVIDSDAAQPDLWVGLSKALHYAGTLVGQKTRHAYTAPSLLSAWTAIFLPRWHDGLVCLPWFFTYLATLGVAYTVCITTTQNRCASLVLAYLFSGLPLGIIHTIRPGYSDFLLTYFFLMGLAVITFAYAEIQLPDRRLWGSVLLVSVSGLLLTKHEGVLGIAWIGAVSFCYGLHRYRGISWKEIMVGTLVAIFILCVLYLLFAQIINASFSEKSRLQYLFNRQYHPKAIPAFLKTAFLYGSFNLWWWFSGIAIFFVMLKPASGASKTLTLYILGLFLFIFYYACFTENIRYTLLQTNMGRALLQLAGLFMPLYILFIKDIFGSHLMQKK